MTVSNLVNNPELKRHTLTKHIRENHIEIEDANLMRRFEENKDKNTKLYSKFKNEKVAEEIISQALENNVERIEKWDKNNKTNPLKIYFKSNTAIGYGFNQDGQKFNLSWLTIILCKNKSQGFRIKSAYPC
jgi:hypothetical protein